MSPKTAFVFAAGLGTRMRPLTDTTPKPLIEVAGRALIDYNLDRFAENGVETAIVNVHYLADQIEAHLKGRERPRIVISDEREKLLDQGGAIKRAAGLIGREPFYVCNTDAFWVEGPRSNLARLAASFDPERMDAILLVAAGAGAVGVDWPGDFEMDAHGRLSRREPQKVAPVCLYRRRHFKAGAVRRGRRGRFPPGAVFLARGLGGSALRHAARRAMAACRAAGEHCGSGKGDRQVGAVTGRAP